MVSQKVSENRGRKWIGNWCQNGPKMVPKPMRKSIKKATRFRDPRFRVFYRKPNVKIVFLHEDGCRKSMKNRSKIDAKTGFRKREPRGPKSERKWSPKWSQKRIFYVKKRKKGPRGAKSVDLEYFRFGARTENGRKKGMSKMMPKFDAGKNRF